ncbi:uncharacterized protein LAESUDRAFT_760339 [Laetiporus sulphureus 93-53]|uniref:Uncharacterized protein n=1 Tax=Laetiporus sulphureus 93-53 TaxID=1314785 RepID=A0A165DRG5_9APHY|nr:uncharacterized protein LAESUDRAFT_760339 [Laetiporus sulphureus 93-53]KZT05472.1 hypothetical protein LAESUDRAFT_760339 [Laetiporus sulphureus 93-53]
MVHVSVQTSSIPVQRASEHGDRLVQDSERNVLEEGPREHTPGRMHGDGRNGLVRGATEHTDRRTPESDPANEVIANLMTKVEQLSLCVEAERDRANRYLKDADKFLREKEESDQEAAYWRAKARRYRQGRHSALVELDQLRFQYEQAMKERESIQVLSEQRRQELDAAQSYLNTADASEQDVVRLVKKMNHEVFQMVRALSDSFQLLHFPRRDENADELVTELIGPSMLELFQSVSDCNDTLALETALQHTLILQIHNMISSWDFDNGNETIPSLYDKILRSESQKNRRWTAGHYP